jgi:hypothetical protein
MPSCVASDAVLDREIGYLGPDGKPQFFDLMRRRRPQLSTHLMCCSWTARPP